MQKHCIAACALGLVALNLVLPFAECIVHQNCHIHPDEPVKTFSIVTSITSSSYIGNGTVSTTTTL